MSYVTQYLRDTISGQGQVHLVYVSACISSLWNKDRDVIPWGQLPRGRHARMNRASIYGAQHLPPTMIHFSKNLGVFQRVLRMCLSL